MSEIIKLIDVWKIYRLGQIDYPALRGVNLSVNKGDLIAIMGPSGSGKTTLLNMIGLLDKPTRGEIYIDGINIRDLTGDEIAVLRNTKIGFVFQQFNLVNRLTVYENIELPLIPRGLSPSQRREMVIKALLMAGGDESWLVKKPFQLSGGQQQRVAIARAIVGNPDIILADEPTGNLDRSSARIVVETFLKLNRQGLTILIVTHDPEIANCTNKIHILRDGRIVESRSPHREECIVSKLG